jgi:hypothetical protein
MYHERGKMVEAPAHSLHTAKKEREDPDLFGRLPLLNDVPQRKFDTCKMAQEADQDVPIHS